MKERAICTHCISHVMNLYPNRRKNPFCSDRQDRYIKVDTAKEANLIKALNYHMRKGIEIMQLLEDYIENEKPC